MKSLTSLTKLVVDYANMLPSMKLPPSLQELTIRNSNIAPELFAQGKPLNAQLTATFFHTATNPHLHTAANPHLHTAANHCRLPACLQSRGWRL